MLDAFRKASQSWFIKILFALLILSFGGLWGAGGLGDLMSARLASQPAIVVGKQEIPATQVVDEFRRDVERLSASFGGKVTTEQARQLGLLQRTIQDIVTRSLLDQAAADLDLGVDNETLRKIIASTPAFQSELHVFDKTVYQRTLARAGFTERQFLDLERRDMAREQLTTMVGEGVKAPAVMADPLFRYRAEQRVAETVTFGTDKMPEPAKPDDATLQKFYKDHAAMFTAPEMRTISAIVIRIADVAADIKPSEQDIEKSYQVRQAEFQSPEKRNVQQVLFNDQAKAQAFADAVRQGKDFAATAKADGRSVSDLGLVDRNGLPLPALADAAFGIPGTGIAGPVQTPLGWHVINVTSVVPAKSRPLSEVRDQIVKDLAKDEATNRLYSLSTKLEDSIGSGAGIDEAASSVNVKPIKVTAMDEQGNGPDGKPVAGIPITPEFLGAAFQTAQGSTSEVTQLKDNSGYFVLHVDSVTPPAEKPFETVKNQVIAAWTIQQKGEEARKQAEQAAERLKKGEPLNAVAGSFKVETTKPFLRAGSEAQGIPPLLVAEMFKAQPGGVAVVPAADGTVVARLKTIIAADPKAQSAQYDRARAQLTKSMSGDLLQQYVMALEKDGGVRINNALIEKQFEK